MRQLHALILGTALSVPSLALAATPADMGQRPVAAHSVNQQAVSSKQATQKDAATSDQKAVAKTDRARYAQKEAQSGEAQNYRGGDTLVIGASAATAILAVILLIVLI
jgi:hypothetical protein